ncbi:MAG TPA: ABC transporter ATP-binding protein [Pseudothermotoga sp.]|nr:ABC transporter ATP-binding protein [Pseudothermotoga sp.]HOK83461.1 ABC transporter ATP-binding protein [Pseudothermotoga sp.]HPP69534.1 ABC transporter ATP-binding protein [Pseudothermotoga sp.]
MSILAVRNLKTYFKTPEGSVKAVDDISFDLKEKEILALVGESGCGKTVTVLTILGLVRGAQVYGSIKYKDYELTKFSETEYTRIRGRKISMIFQEPLSAFDPLYTIGQQMVEVVCAHLDCDKESAKNICIEMLKEVQIPFPEKRFDEYPHEMSGGMLQRVMIAMALVTKPDIIIADEPTTALDVTIQAQVLNLFKQLQEIYKTSIIFITHDFGVVAEVADRVHVMYAGKIVEKATVSALFANPLHPYTKSLLKSRIKKEFKNRTLPYIPGNVPLATDFPSGCRFHPRCDRALKICSQKEPPEICLNHSAVSCWLYVRGDEK